MTQVRAVKFSMTKVFKVPNRKGQGFWYLIAAGSRSKRPYFVFCDMALIRFTRCRLLEDGKTETVDPPVPSREEVQFCVLPLMLNPDTFIFSFTDLRPLFLDNLNTMALVAYASGSPQARKYVTLGPLGFFVFTCVSKFHRHAFNMRILFTNLLALVDFDFAKMVMKDLKVEGVVVMSEKYKFDCDSVMIQVDNTMKCEDHLRLTTTKVCIQILSPRFFVNFFKLFFVFVFCQWFFLLLATYPTPRNGPGVMSVATLTLCPEKYALLQRYVTSPEPLVADVLNVPLHPAAASEAADAPECAAA